MADFIQTFQMDEYIVDFVLKNIEIEEPKNETKTISAEIPELEKPIKGMIKEYLKQIEEYNYIVDINAVNLKHEIYIVYVPPRTFRTWTSETGKQFNVYIFLKDSELIYEFFNPFTRKTVRYKASKGLVIVLPSIWVIVSRYTSTRETDAIFVLGTVYVTDLDNVHETRSSNIFSEASMVHG
jgi:hypothetical protein